MTDATGTAELLKNYSRLDKPVLASWMGGAEVAAGVRILNAANIPTFPYPDTAARAFQYMWGYTYNLRALYETPIFAGGVGAAGADRKQAEAVIRQARAQGRALLSEHESKQVLAAYGIPTVPSRLAATAEEALAAAAEIGYPVVLKLHSETITHKTDVGGVHLNLKNAEAVRAAFEAIEESVSRKASKEDFLGVTVQPMIQVFGYELIVGSSIDAQFGPVLLFGLGGQLVEVFQDRALALPPLNTTLARRMMEQTKIYTALRGVRGRRPVDLAALEALLVRFSQLVVEQPWIKEVDINPLLASPEGLLALDARVVLQEPAVTEAELPKPAIRPYPTQYVFKTGTKDGAEITIRPIRPEDEPYMVRFHETLSERTVYFRYLEMLHLTQRIAHERLTRICFIDYDRQMALVAERRHPQTGLREILGVARFNRLQAPEEAEFAVVISDAAQGKGLGTEMLRRLLEVARQEGVKRLTAEIHPENTAMIHVCEKLGFKLDYQMGDPTVSVEVQLA
jgi:acetyltransferase